MDATFSPSVSVSEPKQLRGQPFVIRATAFIIDQFLMAVVIALSSFLGGIVPGVVLLIADRSNLPEMGWLAEYTIWFTLTLFYFVLCEWICGATPGKLLPGLRVVKEDGSPCTLPGRPHPGGWYGSWTDYSSASRRTST